MRLDRHRTNIIMAMMDVKQKDLVAAGIPRGTLCSAMMENSISERTAERIAQAIGCKTSEILQTQDERR